MLMEMIPVKPRMRMTYHVAPLSENQIPNQKVLDGNLEPCALYHMNVQSCTKRKSVIHERIVVVGCSSTSLGFLEELIFR